MLTTSASGMGTTTKNAASRDGADLSDDETGHAAYVSARSTPLALPEKRTGSVHGAAGGQPLDPLRKVGNGDLVGTVGGAGPRPLDPPVLSLWQRYVLANKTHPLRTKCITTGAPSLIICLFLPSSARHTCSCSTCLHIQTYKPQRPYLHGVSTNHT